MVKRKNFVFIVVLLMVCVFTLTACSNGYIQTQTPEDSVVTINVNNYSVESISDSFDSIEQCDNRIIAHQTFNKEAMTGFVNVSQIKTENIRTSYDVEYSPEEDLIYVSISTFDENDELINVSLATGYPIRYVDSIDASLDFDGKTVLLSELLQDEKEECFFCTLIFGIFSAAKIIATVVTVAKVVAVVTGVVVIGAATYYAASLTAEKIRAREREAEAERRRKKDNPKYYYPAQIKSDKLIIAANPHHLLQAAKHVNTGSSYWTPVDFMAKKLAITASGGYYGPEIDKRNDKPIKGHYYHYHLAGKKAGSHIWFSTPYGNVY